MPQSKVVRYGMFGALYFSQGTILGYFTALNALYLLSKGLEMTDVGILGLIAMIPFVIKIFLGMLSDRVNLLGLGHRKPYILLGLAVQIGSLIVVPFVDPGQYYWGFVALAFALQLGMALYDTCTDGLALDTTPEEEQGTIQTFMVGGRAAGALITSSAVGLLAEDVSWSAVFWLLALLTLVPIPMVLGIKESERPAERQFEWSAFRAFNNRSVIALAGLGFVFFLIIAGANQMYNPFLQAEFGIPLSQAGFYATVWGIGVVLGGVVGGRLVGRIGKLNGTLIAIGISFVSVLALAFIRSPAMAWPIIALFGLGYGTCQTVYYALSMNYTEPRIAASMFSIMMAISNVAQGAGMALTGFLTDSAGYRWTFVILTAFNLLAIPLLPVIFGRKAVAEEAVA